MLTSGALTREPAPAQAAAPTRARPSSSATTARAPGQRPSSCSCSTRAPSASPPSACPAGQWRIPRGCTSPRRRESRGRSATLRQRGESLPLILPCPLPPHPPLAPALLTLRRRLAERLHAVAGIEGRPSTVDLLCARLYTGPCFVKYNAVLRAAKASASPNPCPPWAPPPTHPPLPPPPTLPSLGPSPHPPLASPFFTSSRPVSLLRTTPCPSSARAETSSA